MNSTSLENNNLRRLVSDELTRIQRLNNYTQSTKDNVTGEYRASLLYRPRGPLPKGGFERIIRANQAAKLVVHSVTNFTSSRNKETCIACINYIYSSALEIQIICVIKEYILCIILYISLYSMNELEGLSKTLLFL